MPLRRIGDKRPEPAGKGEAAQCQPCLPKTWHRRRGGQAAHPTAGEAHPGDAPRCPGRAARQEWPADHAQPAARPLTGHGSTPARRSGTSSRIQRSIDARQKIDRVGQGTRRPLSQQSASDQLRAKAQRADWRSVNTLGTLGSGALGKRFAGPGVDPSLSKRLEIRSQLAEHTDRA